MWEVTRRAAGALMKAAGLAPDLRPALFGAGSVTPHESASEA